MWLRGTQILLATVRDNEPQMRSRGFEKEANEREDLQRDALMTYCDESRFHYLTAGGFSGLRTFL
jgi:hypothetical protein